ncbi:hypothetical protein [Candidatus Amarolinea dominans]|uniref:hypothetical protein n=1 Tax=Candidatus Amarolinea dominans TaxID=3140696 RepID=UPI0031CC652F
MNRPQRTFTPRVIVLMLFFIVVIPFLPLLVSWRWDWWEAWAYAAISILGFAISRALAARRHPDLLAERAVSCSRKTPSPGTSAWRRCSDWAARLFCWLPGWTGFGAGRPRSAAR